MKLITSNLAEVGRLVKNRHKLIDVSVAMGNMGAEEVVFTLEGPNIELDRKCFLGTRGTKLRHVLQGVEAIQALILQKEEEEVLHG